jgi:hypothetical protein
MIIKKKIIFTVLSLLLSNTFSNAYSADTVERENPGGLGGGTATSSILSSADTVEGENPEGLGGGTATSSILSTAEDAWAQKAIEDFFSNKPINPIPVVFSCATESNLSSLEKDATDTTSAQRSTGWSLNDLFQPARAEPSPTSLYTTTMQAPTSSNIASIPPQKANQRRTKAEVTAQKETKHEIIKQFLRTHKGPATAETIANNLKGKISGISPKYISRFYNENPSFKPCAPGTVTMQALTGSNITSIPPKISSARKLEKYEKVKDAITADPLATNKEIAIKIGYNKHYIEECLRDNPNVREARTKARERHKEKNDVVMDGFSSCQSSSEDDGAGGGIATSSILSTAEFSPARKSIIRLQGEDAADTAQTSVQPTPAGSSILSITQPTEVVSSENASSGINQQAPDGNVATSGKRSNEELQQTTVTKRTRNSLFGW